MCRVHELRPDAGTVGITAIDKRPVGGPVKVNTLGVYADVQADRANHGGEDKAVYAYSQEDADTWAELLGRDVPAGYFGENLRTSGIATTGAVIGERWQIGSTVVVEVTSPRTPCATFGRRVNEAQWVKRFTQEGRVGCYLRVVTTGSIQGGDAVTVLERPSHGITVGQIFSEPTLERVNTLTALHESGELALADSYWPKFERVLRQSRMA